MNELRLKLKLLVVPQRVGVAAEERLRKRERQRERGSEKRRERDLGGGERISLWPKNKLPCILMPTRGISCYICKLIIPIKERNRQQRDAAAMF